jgi:hypothetical protein
LVYVRSEGSSSVQRFYYANPSRRRIMGPLLVNLISLVSRMSRFATTLGGAKVAEGF